MEKPVWRMNTGKGVPSDLGNGVLSLEGELFANPRRDRVSTPVLWIADGEIRPLIYAYQTTRTKPAKYRGVECK